MIKKILFTLSLIYVLNFSLAFYTKSDVIELSPSTFKSRVVESNKIWLIEFYAPWCGHCKAFVPEYEKTGSVLKNIVKVGAVDADQHRELAQQYGIKGFPTIKIFGLNKTPIDYDGARTADALSNFILSKIKNLVNQRLKGKKSSSSSSDVIELTDNNFNKQVLNSKDAWLVEFYAPTCGHCQRLKPTWEDVATELKGKVKVGALDATLHTITANKYNIQGFPTIKAFINGESEEYQGDRSKESLVNFALEKLDENIPPPEVKQLINEKIFEENCKKSQLCIISVLPHILDCDAKCRNDYLDILKKIGEKFKKKRWSYLWTEALQQPKLEELLGLGGFGYPTMAAVNTRKLKYSWLRGSFSFDGINEFLRDLSYGKGSSVLIKDNKLFEILNVEPWDGKDSNLSSLYEDNTIHSDL